MSNEPDKTQHRASFMVIDVASVSPTERRVRVQVVVSPSRWGYTSSIITLLVGEQGSEMEIRRAVCAKIKQETQLDYRPDELQSPILEAPSASNSLDEARLPGTLEETATELDEIATEASMSNRARKRKVKK